MKYSLFSRVALHNDLHRHGFKKGDIGTVVQHIKGDSALEDGYCIEIFDVLGNTMDVIVVKESDIEPLLEKEIPNARRFEVALPVEQ